MLYPGSERRGPGRTPYPRAGGGDSGRTRTRRAEARGGRPEPYPGAEARDSARTPDPSAARTAARAAPRTRPRTAGTPAAPSTRAPRTGSTGTPRTRPPRAGLGPHAVPGAETRGSGRTPYPGADRRDSGADRQDRARTAGTRAVRPTPRPKLTARATPRTRAPTPATPAVRPTPGADAAAPAARRTPPAPPPGSARRAVRPGGAGVGGRCMPGGPCWCSGPGPGGPQCRSRRRGPAPADRGPAGQRAYGAAAGHGRLAGRRGAARPAGHVLLDDGTAEGTGRGSSATGCAPVRSCRTSPRTSRPPTRSGCGSSRRPLGAELKRRAELLGRAGLRRVARPARGTRAQHGTAVPARPCASARPAPDAERRGRDLDTPPARTLRLRPAATRGVGARAPAAAAARRARRRPRRTGRSGLGSHRRGPPPVRSYGRWRRWPGTASRLGVHWSPPGAPGPHGATPSWPGRRALRIVLDAPACRRPPTNRRRAGARLGHPDGRVTPFQGGRVTGRIPRTATLRPTVVPLEWERMGDPPARRPVRELGNGPTDLALLASALERAARSVNAEPAAADPARPGADPRRNPPLDTLEARAPLTSCPGPPVPHLIRRIPASAHDVTRPSRSPCWTRTAVLRRPCTGRRTVRTATQPGRRQRGRRATEERGRHAQHNPYSQVRQGRSGRRSRRVALWRSPAAGRRRTKKRRRRRRGQTAARTAAPPSPCRSWTGRSSRSPPSGPDPSRRTSPRCWTSSRSAPAPRSPSSPPGTRSSTFLGTKIAGGQPAGRGDAPAGRRASSSARDKGWPSRSAPRPRRSSTRTTPRAGRTSARRGQAVRRLLQGRQQVADLVQRRRPSRTRAPPSRRPGRTSSTTAQTVSDSGVTPVSVGGRRRLDPHRLVREHLPLPGGPGEVRPARHSTRSSGRTRPSRTR